LGSWLHAIASKEPELEPEPDEPQVFTNSVTAVRSVGRIRAGKKLRQICPRWRRTETTLETVQFQQHGQQLLKDKPLKKRPKRKQITKYKIDFYKNTI
jgi:hypothetical protein